MILRVLSVSMIGFTLAGCVSNSGLSGDVYSASEAKQVQSVTYGTIVHTRAVQIRAEMKAMLSAHCGAVLGGFLGNTIGGGTGRSLATAAGAVAGGVAGQGVQGAMNKTQGVELEIRKDDGNPSWWCRNKAARRSQSDNAWLLPAAAARLPYPRAKSFPCGPCGPLIYIKYVSFIIINNTENIFIFFRLPSTTCACSIFLPSAIK